ncbi:uncharacterized protein FA14DRAFT_188100 [Meira miltonrushii]|uniref:BIR-domain-containing protein n=1 Tax=Meira miltonrushii TaxID=1280837 RepID=A0A316VK52_9BASI|nr:uncharacterized protein FA14DRAFT_188100 [Meira miltonrushii]PWN38067.1 hypothetical protein FA14DRAFT_188100 [Meira miltonrushii]
MTGVNRSMSSYEARRATFFVGTEESSKSRKKTVPVWPHPINLTEDALEDDNNGSGSSSTSSILKEKRTKRYPTPSELANLGLYFDPSASDEQDACVLFPENVVLSGWKLGDDVAQKIREAVPKATILTIHESKDAAHQDNPKKDAWTWKDEDLLPTSKSMIATRLKTFTPTWPYDSKKGWKPTSKKLASAGFHYFPNEEEDDCARCQYCELVLGGWEKTDDPMHEHERRRPTCPFFNCALAEVPSVEIVSSPVVEVTKKTRSASTATKRARAVSKRKAKDEDEVEVQEDDPEQKAQEQEEEQPATSKASCAQKEPTVESQQKQEEVEAPRKIAPSRKVSRKVQKVEETEPSPERAPVQVAPEPQARVETDAEMEHDAPEEVAAESTPAAAPAASSSQNERKSSDLDEPSSQKDLESDQPASSSSPKRFSEPDPFMIEPLKKIPKLTPAEEDMTVEAWLKTQVLSACQEMENEGIERIEKLRQQIGKGRAEIEAVLRGRSLNPTVS